MTSRPLAIGKEFEQADAVIYTWHPGSMGGPALASIVSGAVVPSGKLPVSFPKTAGQIPIYYNHKMTGRPASAESFVPIEEIPVRSFKHHLAIQATIWMLASTHFFLLVLALATVVSNIKRPAVSKPNHSK